LKISRFSKFLLLLLSFISFRSYGAPWRVVAYYPSWSTTSPLDLPGERFTHLIYAFVHVSDDGLCDAGPSLRDAELLNDFKKLKSKFPHLKTLLAVGGADNSKPIAAAARTNSGRRKLVTSCLEFLDRYDFDGVDLDWEFPTPVEKGAMVSLLKEFRNQLPKAAVLSAAVTADESIADLDVTGMGEYLDWLSVMAYDRCELSSSVTCHHAQFFSTAKGALTGQQAIQRYLDAGARADQLLLGLPFYGYKWKVQSADADHAYGLGQKILGKKSAMEVSYAQIMQKYNERTNYQFFFDDEAQAPLMFNEDSNEMISFDNPQSLAAKRAAALEMGLGGIMIWDITGDDDQNSLLESVTK
jgi:chitinase